MAPKTYDSEGTMLKITDSGTCSNESSLASPSPSSSRVSTQYLATGLATLMAVAMGTHLAWSASALDKHHLPSSKIDIDTQEISWIGSLIALGACLGATPAGFICTKLGPKRTLQLISLPLLLSWYIIGFSVSVWNLYAARLIAGLATGATCVAAPMYVADLADTRIRGTLGTCFQLQVTMGLLIGFIFGGVIYDFQLLALVSSVVPIVFLATFWTMPESPVFLCTRGRIDEARKALTFFRGSHYNVEEELDRIRYTVTASATGNNEGLRDILRNKASRKALFISLSLMFFQQVSGINAVLFFATEIFDKAGTTMSPALCTIIVGLVQVLATYASTMLIEKLGRKILLFVSSAMMSLCISVLSIYFYYKDHDYDVSSFAIVPVVCLALFIIAFSIGYGPIPWVMMGELFSPSAKGFASSTSASFNWLLAFSVTFGFLAAKESLGSASTFGFFAAISALAAIYSKFVVPETKGKTLEEIQDLLIGRRRVNDEEEGLRTSKNPQFVES